jgi:hypothetical protein
MGKITSRIMNTTWRTDDKLFMFSEPTRDGRIKFKYAERLSFFVHSYGLSLA